MRCPFSTLTLVNMTNGEFLPGWAKYWEKDMQIRNVSTHRMIYQTWKYLWWLWLHLNIEHWKGRCKWLNAQWLLSFSPGDTATMKKVAVAFSVNKLGMTEEKRYLVSSSQEALNDLVLTSCFGHCLTSHAIDGSLWSRAALCFWFCQQLVIMTTFLTLHASGLTTFFLLPPLLPLFSR